MPAGLLAPSVCANVAIAESVCDIYMARWRVCVEEGEERKKDKPASLEGGRGHWAQFRSYGENPIKRAVWEGLNYFCRYARNNPMSPQSWDNTGQS